MSRAGFKRYIFLIKWLKIFCLTLRNDVWFLVYFGVPPLWRQLRISENLKYFPDCLQPGCTTIIRDMVLSNTVGYTDIQITFMPVFAIFSKKIRKNLFFVIARYAKNRFLHKSVTQYSVFCDEWLHLIRFYK